jgi:DNA primase
MAGRIPKAFIDELIARADIVEVVGARVALKRAGSNYKGLCPFHGEKTPSFTVSPSKGFYHCFGCSAHGTAIGFLMAYDNLEFPEAVEALAEMMGLEVPRETTGAPERKEENEELYALLREADQIYRAALRSSETAIAYVKKRGIDGPTAGRFGIGYAPNAWDTVLRALGNSDERVAKLTQAGLVVTNDSGRRYDRFRDRIMFPIRNARGQVIGFGGRVLDSGEPKYLNSPETPVFRKGHELYGLFEAKQNPGRPKQIIVVEGYLDVASLVQHGVENVVATLGTATTTENLRRLTRLTDRILFCFDGDRAGRAAAWRALETALPYGGGTLELKFLLLPEGDDPDSFVRSQGPDAFRALAEKAHPLSDFLVKELATRVDLKTVDGRSRFQAVAKPLLKRLPEGTYRAAVMDAFGSELRLKPDVLNQMMSDEAPAAPPPRPILAGGKRKTRVQHVISLALHYPQAAARLEETDSLEQLTQPGADLLREILALARSLPAPTTAQLLEHFRDDPNLKHLEKLVAEEPLDGPEAAQQVLSDTLALLIEESRKSRAAAAVLSHKPEPQDV